MKKHKYDVAFSFLAQDEDIAVRLNDLLKGRYSTFVYSEKQRDVAGADGEIAFTSVFSDESLVVVVLYKKGWGETSWTRIEQTAIRNRAFDNGYDFALFIPLEKHPDLPKWLPKTQLWIGLDRWGLETTAGVIEARIQEAGGTEKAETSQELAARIKRDIEWEKDRKKRLNSEDGVKDARMQAEELHAIIKSKIEMIEKESALGLSVQVDGPTTWVRGPSIGMAIQWDCRYTNTLNDSSLYFGIWDGAPPKPGYYSFREPQEIASTMYKFDYNRLNSPCWTKDASTLMSNEQLSETIISAFLDELHKRQLNRP